MKKARGNDGLFVQRGGGLVHVLNFRKFGLGQKLTVGAEAGIGDALEFQHISPLLQPPRTIRLLNEPVFRWWDLKAAAFRLRWIANLHVVEDENQTLDVLRDCLLLLACLRRTVDTEDFPVGL